MATAEEAYMCLRAVAGHAWDEIPVTRPPSFGVGVWWRCVRCTSLRKYIVNQFSGAVEARDYQKSDAFAAALAMVRDQGFANGDEIRRHALRIRAVEQRELRIKLKRKAR